MNPFIVKGINRLRSLGFYQEIADPYTLDVILYHDVFQHLYNPFKGDQAFMLATPKGECWAFLCGVCQYRAVGTMDISNDDIIDHIKTNLIPTLKELVTEEHYNCLLSIADSRRDEHFEIFDEFWASHPELEKQFKAVM